MKDETVRLIVEELTAGLKAVDTQDELEAFLTVAQWIVHGE